MSRAYLALWIVERFDLVGCQWLQVCRSLCRVLFLRVAYKLIELIHNRSSFLLWLSPVPLKPACRAYRTLLMSPLP